ncbi:Mitochondrial porin [Clydaea vesicula]|uniref:Mitochondrial porin n=1 Tax=Clydaea vesicula TaxID=447962 RepID=A0AAD5U3D0_9FUNG|nr:Mitochondrial porin [Clydaea vesicula]
MFKSKNENDVEELKKDTQNFLSKVTDSYKDLTSKVSSSYSDLSSKLEDYTKSNKPKAKNTAVKFSFIPPNFGDVNKLSNDLFNKDFPIGATKLELNTNASNGVKFTAIGIKDNKSGQVSSELKTKFTDKLKGLTLTESWNTSNVLGTNIELADTLTKGLKLTLNGQLHPTIGKKNAKAGFEFKQANVYTRAHVDLFKGPTIVTDAVVGNADVLIGADVNYDVTDAKVNKFNTVVAHTSRDYTISVGASNMFGLFSFSYFHRVQPGLEAGARAHWNKATDSAVSVEIGAKYALDIDSFVKAKINNTGVLGLGYYQNLRQGVKLGFGASLDTTRLNENAHKVGFSFNFEG